MNLKLSYGCTYGSYVVKVGNRAREFNEDDALKDVFSWIYHDCCEDIEGMYGQGRHREAPGPTVEILPLEKGP